MLSVARAACGVFLQCTVDNEPGCTPDMRYRAVCNVYNAPFDLPAHHQYFTNPKRGGQNPYLDYCPTYWRLSNGDCQDTSTIGV